MTDRNEVIQAFRNYTAEYNPADPKIKLKIDHTYRVAGLCAKIAVEAKADPELSWLCGMLHDIGRFEQVRRYNTFVDAESVDHASLSCELLFQDGLISSFAPDLEPEAAYLLKTAIHCHSLYRLPDTISEEERTYCNILRDADKIDIFRVNCDTPPEEIYNVSTYDLTHAEITPAVKRQFSAEDSCQEGSPEDIHRLPCRSYLPCVRAGISDQSNHCKRTGIHREDAILPQ